MEMSGSNKKVQPAKAFYIHLCVCRWASLNTFILVVVSLGSFKSSKI